MSGPAVTRDQFRHVAKLARIQLTPEEEELYFRQLLPILEHIDNLKKVNTDTLTPSFQTAPVSSRLRHDQVLSSLDQKTATSSVDTNSGYFVVPQSIDK